MFEKVLILISLFSYSISIYLPLIKKEMDFVTDDICLLYEGSAAYDEKIYVKACDKGFYCNYFTHFNPNDIGICLEYKPSFKKYNEKCDDNSECIGNLECIDHFCLVNENNDAYIHEEYSNEEYYYCSNNTIPILYKNIEKYKCEKKVIILIWMVNALYQIKKKKQLLNI